MNNKFKKIIFLSTLLFALAVVVPSVRADAMSDLNNLKFKAANDCASLNPSLAQWKIDFTVAASDKYKYIEANVTSGGLTLPALSGAMLGIANTAIGGVGTGLADWCTDMQAFTLPAQLDAAKTRYAELRSVLKIREVIFPLFEEVVRANAFYGKAKKFGDDKDYLNIVNTTVPFTAYNGVGELAEREGTGLTQVLGSLATAITAMNANAPVAAFYAAIPGKAEALAKADIESIRSKLGIASERMSSASTLVRSGRDFAGTIINFAAQNGDALAVTASVELNNAYQKLLDTYNGRAQSLCENVKNIISREIANLDLMSINITSGDFNSLLPSTAVATAIQNRITVVKTGLTAALATLPAVDCITDFKTVVDAMSAVKTFNIDISLKPVYQIAKGFNKSYAKANDLKVNFTDVFNTVAIKDGIDAGLPGGLPVAGVQDPDLIALNKAINDAATGVLPKQLTPLLAQKASIEANISAAIVDPVKLGVLKSSVNTFNSQLSATSSEISRLRTEWWRLIALFTKNSTNVLPGELANEQRAAKLFNDFQAKKGSLKNAAQRIVDSRNMVLDKYQFAVDGLQNIPLAAKVDFTVRTANLKADLATRLVAINNAKNYDDIKTQLNEIKDLGIAQVYVPSMRMYIRFDEYYKKLATLQTLIMPALDLKINDLAGGNTNQVVASGSLRSTYIAVDALLGTLKTDLDAALMTEMVNTLNTPGDSTLFATLKGKETIARNTLTSIIAQLRQLSSYITTAEKLK